MKTPIQLDRRDFLHRAAGSAMGAAALRARLSLAAALNDGHPLAPRRTHFPARAKRLV